MKLLITGTGRCGTKTMQMILNSIPHTFCYHDKHNDGFVRLSGKIFDRENRAYYPHKLLDNESFVKKILTNELTMIREKKRDGYDVCISHCYSYTAIPFLVKRFPYLKVVQIVRSGYDVVRSYYHRPSSYPDIPEFEYSGYAAAKPRPFPSNQFYADWDNWGTLKKLSWFWRFINRYIEQLCNKYVPAENYNVLKLENLTEERVKKLLNWAEIDPRFNVKTIKVHNKNVGNFRLKWTKGNILKFNEIAGETMEHFNYSLR